MRGLGLGSVLFDRIAHDAIAMGCRTVEITTHSGNVAMKALARKFEASIAFSHGEGTGRMDLAAWERELAA